MPSPQNSPSTAFSRDLLGRFVCNGLDEALASAGSRPHDYVVIGGGSFGAIFAQHLFASDTERRHRILVLEAGPFLLPEHVQNLPLLWGGVPGPTSIQDLRAAGRGGQPREEVWGLAWHSGTPFPGLAYTVGGRSLFWGGWSPEPLAAEMSPSRWPTDVASELLDTYFPQAREQLGVDEANDFIFGELHSALRQRLFEGLAAGRVTDALPLSEVRTHLRDEVLRITEQQADLSKLEAPLAVQSRTRSGFFPFNKFSALPLLIRGCRQAWLESGGDDTRKRLMVVPNCHASRLDFDGSRVTGVFTNLGYVAVVPGGRVFLACGTIESTRLALLSFGGIPGYERIGRNLLAHLRSNLTIRVPREELKLAERELQASALFVKGRHRFSDRSVGHFHLQITASAVPTPGSDSEAELFKKVPDLDTIEALRQADDKYVVITVRGIGEMEPDNPRSRITLDPERDEFGEQRAFVSILASERDQRLWSAMDRAALDVANVFSGGRHEVLTRAADGLAGPAHDGLGTTHHEAGTLRMGDDPESAVTDAFGRFYGVQNAYALGPALLPTTGSPNPMLSGTALARRLVKRLLIERHPVAPTPEFEMLFDGRPESLAGWKLVGEGSVEIRDGAIVMHPGQDLGLLYYTRRQFQDFLLRCEVSLSSDFDNSGVFVRFRDPELPPPGQSKPYRNKAWVAVRTGFEVQIDERAGGNPGGLDQHRTGAIYGVPLGAGNGRQLYRRGPEVAPGLWSELEVEVRGQRYEVRIDGVPVASFTNIESQRGRGPKDDPNSGFIGLQLHSGAVAFRDVRILEGQRVAGRVRAREEVVGAAKK
jgi:choline dehydrogenase-like flavoprotein